MNAGFFVTGTDTGVGKTLISAALMIRLARDGTRVAGMKPVASGCARTAQGLRNDDALLLAASSTVVSDYDLINPFAFEPAVAPHLAAQDAGVAIDSERIMDAFRTLAGTVDQVVVEGVGGWLVPIGGRLTMADVARRMQLPVILVVGVRLGCINHALLTEAAVTGAGLRLAGWVANRIDRACERADEVVDALRQRLHAPLLGDVPWMASPLPERVAGYLRGCPQSVS